ncbi:MAG: hypothetical protein CL915_12830 [Deltaproteobacteria bacterium]|nr:hypothetical protein [Deltaproteobacteria bacterium]
MNSIHFSDWLINSLQKVIFKDSVQQNLANKIKTSIIENSTKSKKLPNDKKGNEIDFTKQAFEIVWNHGFREISLFENLHFRSISANIGSTNWCQRCFVEGKIVLDTWTYYPSRQSWIQSCHSLLKQMNDTENYVWIIDISKLKVSDQSDIILLAPCLHPVSKKLISGWIIGENQYFPESSSWWGNTIYQSLDLEKAFYSIGLLEPPEENSRWARRKRHWKRIINDWKKKRPETSNVQRADYWDKPNFDWEELSPKDQSNLLRDLLSWLEPI